MDETKAMSFKEALKILNIEDYGERIFSSNSHGELFHLADYIMLAKSLPETGWFREWFIKVVEKAEKEWQHPEYVFQHILKTLPGSAFQASDISLPTNSLKPKLSGGSDEKVE
jgi:hypothetical protein